MKLLIDRIQGLTTNSHLSKPSSATNETSKDGIYKIELNLALQGDSGIQYQFTFRINNEPGTGLHAS